MTLSKTSEPDKTGGLVDFNSPHRMTGVDKAHETGIYSEGVRVAIIDTGIDYLCPALGGCFGPGWNAGSASEDIIVAGMQRAADTGVDLISMSIGAYGSYGDRIGRECRVSHLPGARLKGIEFRHGSLSLFPEDSSGRATKCLDCWAS